MKTPAENKIIGYKEMRDVVIESGFEHTDSGSISQGKVWSRRSNMGPYTLKGAFSIIQAGTKTKEDPRPEKKETKKSKKLKDDGE